jgi:hypothetical protein
MARSPEFGISITPHWSRQDEILGLARVADEAGLDLVGIQPPFQAAVPRDVDVDRSGPPTRHMSDSSPTC